MKILKLLFPPKVAWYTERKILHAYYGWTQCEIHNLEEGHDNVLNFHGGYGSCNTASIMKKVSLRKLNKMSLKMANKSFIENDIPLVGKFVVLLEKDRRSFD